MIEKGSVVQLGEERFTVEEQELKGTHHDDIFLLSLWLRRRGSE
jgi:hypothetical protein